MDLEHVSPFVQECLSLDATLGLSWSDAEILEKRFRGVFGRARCRLLGRLWGRVALGWRVDLEFTIPDDRPRPTDRCGRYFHHLVTGGFERQTIVAGRQTKSISP